MLSWMVFSLRYRLTCFNNGDRSLLLILTHLLQGGGVGLCSSGSCGNGGLGLSPTDIAFFCLLERRRPVYLLPPSSTICQRGFLFSPKIQMLVKRYSYLYY
jgi:hypothetical protein